MPAKARARSHYQTLGVSRDATKTEIQRAYRALARTLHPDTGKTADEKRFIEATLAYEVLSDGAKRKAYDAALDGAAAAKTAASATPHYTWENVAASRPKGEPRPSKAELDDLYDTFFGGPQ